MAELRDCPTCGDFFNYTGVRDVCGKCATKEEKMFEVVFAFLRIRANRTATIEQLIENTGVTDTLLHKWVRKGRLQPALFPNLGYPCDKCGRLTSKGKLCVHCTEDIQSELRIFDAAVEFREAIKKNDESTYHTEKNRNK